jgi:hypothetical protein
MMVPEEENLMNASLIQNISAQVYRQFPEVAGCQPKVSLYPLPKGKEALANYLLIYNRQTETSNGKTILRIVRVVATEKGKIVKMTTSR